MREDEHMTLEVGDRGEKSSGAMSYQCKIEINQVTLADLARVKKVSRFNISVNNSL